MTNLMNNLNEQLFTELTPVEAAAIQGGENPFTTNVYLDSVDSTGNFKVADGGTITINSNITGIRGTNLKAAIVSTATGNSDTKTVDYGVDETKWTNVIGGEYKIVFTDEDDGYIASGPAKVSWTQG